MDICVEAILYEQKSVLIQMLELYQYDFSEFSDDDINEYGYFGYAHIDDYWNEEGRHPFFIRVNGKLAGLVLVRSCCEHNTLPTPHCIAEFFVMKKYRQKGVGRAAAMKIFDMFHGGWEVSQWVNNLPAQNFWRKVVVHCGTMKSQVDRVVWLGKAFLEGTHDKKEVMLYIG